MTRLHTPNLHAPIAGDLFLTPAWAKYLRELHEQIEAELSPGRIAPFYLSAADLADATQFVQAGTTAGLGVGIRRGWALVNGNNGTPAGFDAKYLAWSTAAAGTSFGSDSVTLAAANLPPHAHALTDPGHAHAQYVTANPGSGGSGIRQDYDGDATGLTAYAQGINTAGSSTGITMGNGPGTSTAFDNRPATKTLVPLMRV